MLLLLNGSNCLKKKNPVDYICTHLPCVCPWSYHLNWGSVIDMDFPPPVLLTCALFRPINLLDSERSDGWILHSFSENELKSTFHNILVNRKKVLHIFSLSHKKGLEVLWKNITKYYKIFWFLPFLSNQTLSLIPCPFLFVFWKFIMVYL